MKPRVFYYAPASTDRINAAHAVQLDVPAVRNKVLGVCTALAAVEQEAMVVTSVVPLPSYRFLSLPEIVTEKGVPLIIVPVIGSYVVKRISASLALLLFTMRRVRRSDRVILYNFFPEYVFAAFYLWLVGNPAVLDMEDGPISEDTNLISRITRGVYPILDKLCAKRRLIVSHQLARRLGYTDYMPIYGVAGFFDAEAPSGERFFGDEMHVLFGGNIMAGTGADLFVDTVRLLRTHYPQARLHLHVTGHYDRAKMTALAEEPDGGALVKLNLHGSMTMASYHELARACAVGLCLKLPSHSVGQTTFPSKVVEIAAMGMVLVTMDVSDVRLIFGEDGAVVLQGEAPEELARSLADLENGREAAAALALAGQTIVREKLSSEKVGAQLLDFLLG